MQTNWVMEELWKSQVNTDQLRYVEDKENIEILLIAVLMWPMFIVVFAVVIEWLSSFTALFALFC